MKREYTELLIRVVEAFDRGPHGWHTVVVTDEDNNYGRCMVCEELEDLLTEIEELLEDNHDYIR